ncbi:hypothetical protein BZA05DRAFT_268999 [Tricharina praecox]|uniref:uncharacterized protein n=1 Tax=Tricharina praecox TaxID=43433 RepID=UPI00221F0485|nr:uncharacterized protein BZA05DRAFT_268999 [Tricharina praecox]KAI5853753.1 hypothetical protein BZA05DRAFT_268999 [Tricharina praecox]
MPTTTAPHPRPAAPTPTAAAAAAAATTATPAGQQHRGFLSFRTTFNFFKYTSRATPPRRDLIGPSPSAVAAVATQASVYNYSVPLIAEEEYDKQSHENNQIALLPTSPARSGAESVLDSQSYRSSQYHQHHLHHHHHSTNTFEGFGRPRRDTLRSPTPNGTTSEFRDMNAGALIVAPGSRSGLSELERPKSNTDKQSSSSAGGKKTAAKLRMALSLLRRKSNQNLRKAYVEPVDETAEGWNTFNNADSLHEPDFEPGRLVPQPAGRRGSTTKSHGFKFMLPARSSSRAILTKPRREDQPRRATLASISIVPSKDVPGDNLNGVHSRPRSSQSTLPGENLAADEPGDDSIFTRESAAFVGGGASSPTAGGLFPRPASLQRHWSDGLRKQGEGAAERKPTPANDSVGISLGITPRIRQGSQDPDRIRPLSFGGISNGYGNMRITEAAALEVRVNELESQVSDLRTIIADANWPPRTGSMPFDGSVLHSSPSHSFSRPDSDTAVAPDESIHRYEHMSHRGSLGARDRTLSALEGFMPDGENKRNTLSTIRAPRRASMRSISESPHSVSTTEYNGVVAMVKREQKARKRLEQQVATLQEQMAAVLHRQLISESTSRSPTMLDSRFSSHLHRKTSSEVPTPDITPPSSRSAVRQSRQSMNMFTSFDSHDASSDCDEDEEEDDDDEAPNYYGQHESWRTPTEERGNPLDGPRGDDAFGDALSSFAPAQGRTLSLSRLTRA